MKPMKLRCRFLCKATLFGMFLVVGFLSTGATGHAAVPRQAQAVGCRVKESADVICGFDGPEDLAETPDGRYVLASELPPDQSHPQGPFFRKIDLKTGVATALEVTYAPAQGWGDDACSSPEHVGLSTHGIDVSTRPDGRVQLLAVNHAQRESIESFELKSTSAGSVAIWRGCAVLNTGAFNDVAALRTGGFIATVMLDKGLVRGGNAMDLMFSGVDTGYLAEWHPQSGFERLAGSEAGVNNGIQLSADERYVYFTAWSTRKLLRYNRRDKRIDGVIRLSLYPDNLTVGDDGTMLVTGLKDLQHFHECTIAQGHFCNELLGFTVAEVDPATMQARIVRDIPPGVMAGGSVALKVHGSIYLGSYTGNRVVRISPQDSPGR